MSSAEFRRVVTPVSTIITVLTVLGDPVLPENTAGFNSHRVYAIILIMPATGG